MQKIKAFVQERKDELVATVACIGLVLLAICLVNYNSYNVESGNQFGANPLPTDGYDSFLSTPLNSSDTTVYVNALPGGVTSSIYTIFSSDGRTVAEKISCTSKTTSPNRLTGCARGLSLTPNADGSVDETPGTGRSHSKNARIAITDTINFTGKALAILNGSQATGSNFLRIGTATTTDGDPCVAFDDGSSPTTTRICKSTGSDMLYWSTDGVNTFNFTSSSISTLGASTTKGIGITNSLIHINASTTQGLTFGADGYLAVKYNPFSFYSDANGLGIATDQNFAWTGTNTFNGNGFTSTTAANSILVSRSSGKIDDGWLGLTTAGDTVYSNGTDLVRVPGGSEKQFWQYGSSNSVGWANASLVFASTTPITVGNTSADTVLFSNVLPGGTLGTNRMVVIESHVSSFGLESDNGSDEVTFNFKYGGSTECSRSFTNESSAGDIAGTSGFIRAYIYGTGATNTQRCTLFIDFKTAAQTYTLGDSTTGYDYVNGINLDTAAIDSTANQVISVTIDGEDGAPVASNTITVNSTFVYVIQ